MSAGHGETLDSDDGSQHQTWHWQGNFSDHQTIHYIKIALKANAFVLATIEAP